MSEIKVNSIKGVAASTAAITVNNTDGTCTANITNNLSNRNLIINGAMEVAQRATTNNTTGAQSTYHTLDRFMTQISVGTITESQQDLATSDTPYTLGFRKYMRVLNQSGISAATNQYLQIDQRIEAQNVAQSGWNYTSSSSFITVSFWVRASVTQSYVGVLQTADGTERHYPFEISLTADQWTKVSKTIPGDSGITVNNDNGKGLTVSFIVYYGTQFTGGSGTFNAWNTTGSGLTRWPDMTTTWATTTNATFDVTGVQLEVGSVATDFEHRSYQDEFLRCCRYFYFTNSQHFSIARGNNSDGVVGFVETQVPLRATPSVTLSGNWRQYGIDSNSSSSTQPTCPSFRANQKGIRLNQTGHSGVNDDCVTAMFCDGSNGDGLKFDSEL